MQAMCSRQGLAVLHTGADPTVGYEDWSEAAVARLAQYDSLSPADVAGVLVGTLGERPLFCDLLTHVTLSLEHESGYESVRAFKAAASRALNIVSDTITVRTALDRTTVEELVIAALALAAPLWQAGHPAENVQRLYREEPELAHVAIDFEHTLTRLIAALADGLIGDQRARKVAEQQA